MLSADKNVTLTEFQIKTLQIREKELNYFVSLYNSISGKYHAGKETSKSGSGAGIRVCSSHRLTIKSDIQLCHMCLQKR